MKQINKKYITFEQAKVLKEKGFTETTKACYSLDGTYCNLQDEIVVGKTGVLINPDVVLIQNKVYSPEQHELIEWLFTNHKVYIHTTIIGDEETVINNECEWSVSVYKDKMYSLRWGSKVTEGVGYFKSKQEALSAAFDYILENLI